MSLVPYVRITVYMREGHRGKGGGHAGHVIDRIRGLGLCARAVVTKASEGCFESGEIASTKMLVLSTDLPETIDIIVPETDSKRVLDELDRMIEDGIVAVSPLPVVFHRVAKKLLPAHLQVRHVMSGELRTTKPDTSVPEAARTLIEHRLLALPVIDDAGRVLGIFAQRDLFQAGYLPMRAGLLSILDDEAFEKIMAPLSGRTVRDLMTSPAETIAETTYLPDALRALLAAGRKRMPAVEEKGRLTGMFARLDILKAITNYTPAWYQEPLEHVTVGNLRLVADAVRKDSPVVSPTSPLSDVLDRMLASAACCVAVVDDGLLVGVIFDQRVVAYLRDEAAGLWELVTGKVSLKTLKEHHQGLSQSLHETAARDLMGEAVSARTDAPVEEAIRIMSEKGIRNIPVVDPEGRFAGMVNRTDLLLGELG